MLYQFHYRGPAGSVFCFQSVDLDGLAVDVGVELDAVIMDTIVSSVHGLECGGLPRSKVSNECVVGSDEFTVPVFVDNGGGEAL